MVSAIERERQEERQQREAMNQREEAAYMASLEAEEERQEGNDDELYREGCGAKLHLSGERYCSMCAEAGPFLGDD